MDGKVGAFSGANQALMADAWNRQLHAEEAQKLSELMEGKSLKEKQRLVEEATYLPKASAGVPGSDSKEAQLQAMQS